MYVRAPGLGGFWGSLWKFNWGSTKVVAATAVGYATGGPAGAVVAGARETQSVIQQNTQARPATASLPKPVNAPKVAKLPIQQPGSFIESLSNTQLAVGAAGGAAGLILLLRK